MKSTWSILNEVINDKKVRVIYQRRLMLMTRKYPFYLRSHFCAYFTNIGSNLANSIPPGFTSHRSFSLWSFFEFVVPTQPTTEQENIEKCTSFRVGTASG